MANKSGKGQKPNQRGRKRQIESYRKKISRVSKIKKSVPGKRSTRILNIKDR